MEKTTNTNSVQKATQPKTAVAKITEKALVSSAKSFIKDNSIAIPANYDVSGAVVGFYNALLNTEDRNKRPALEVCTPSSINNTLFEMISNGLDIRKKQAYLIVYGKSLTLQKSYFGTQKAAKAARLDLSDFRARVIYAKDTYETEILADGRKVLVKHEQPFNQPKELDNIIGAYSIVMVDGEADLEEMTIEQIKKSWAKSKTGGAVHKEFPEEMCKKTVITRHAKRFINTSDDSAVLSNTADNPYGEAENAEVEKVESNKVTIDDDTDFYPADNDTVDDEITPDEMAEANAEMFGGAFDDIPMACVDCGVTINEKVNEFSTKRFGKPLCFKCQKEQK